jgi:hypothetical protein
VISGILFPAALLSSTLLLYDFHKGEVGIGKKYAKVAYFLAISGNSSVQKGMALLLQEKVRQFTCYWRTMICVIMYLCLGYVRYSTKVVFPRFQT